MAILTIKVKLHMDGNGVNQALAGRWVVKLVRCASLQRRKGGIMRIEAYLRVLSTEARIRALHNEAQVSTASIKETKARRAAVGTDVWWNWCTQRVSIDIDKIDDGLRTLLLAYKPIFPIIKKHQGPETDAYLEMITHYDQGEEPQGLYLSAETVALLSQMGGAFDSDIYSETYTGGSSLLR